MALVSPHASYYLQLFCVMFGQPILRRTMDSHVRGHAVRTGEVKQVLLGSDPH